MTARAVFSLLLLSWLFAADTQAQWEMVPSPVLAHMTDIAFSSPSVGWIVGYGGALMRSTDGGLFWQVILPGPAGSTILTEVDFLDSLRGCIAGGYGTLLTTSDGGRTWQLEYDNNPLYSHYYGLALSSQAQGLRVIAVGGTDESELSSFLERPAETEIWEPLMLGFAGRLVGISMLGDSVGWAVGMAGAILKTTNGGRWWNMMPGPVDPEPNTGYNSVCPMTENVLLACGDHGMIIKSTDAGESWRRIPYGENHVLFKLWRDSDSAAYIVGESSTILLTTDQGETWHRQTVNAPPTTFQDIVFLDTMRGWAVGTDGVIVRTINAGGPTSMLEPPGLPPNFRLLPAYPNPFNPETTISFEIARRCRVSLTIYNALGEVVVRLLDGEFEPGYHSAVWNAGGAASGTYWCRMTAEGFGETRRIVLLR